MSRALIQVLTKELNPFLFPKNDFIAGNAMFDNQGADSDMVTVNESQELPKVIENQTVFPLPVAATEHTRKSYTIDTLRSLPTFVLDTDELLTNFSIQQNELRKHGETIKRQYYDKIAHSWAQDGSSSLRRTTGALSTFAMMPGMTGSRRALTREDWIGAISDMAKQDVPTEGLKALVPEVIYWQMITLPEFTEYQKTGVTDPAITGGAMGEYLGVKIYRRNGVPFYNTDATTKLNYLEADGSRHEPSGAENLSVMIWHPAFVRYSLGNENIYLKEGDPTLQGNLMSTNVRCGASRSRTDNKGVVMIVQANS